MAIIAQEFEQLVTARGEKYCDFNELYEKSHEIKNKWINDIVVNEEKPNFELDENMRFHYLTKDNKRKEADITNFGFSQLCARMGIPTNYIQKCFKSGKEELALQNFRAWASETNQNMLVRENDGVIRAVLSDSYTPFDSFQIIRSLKYTVDFGRWKLTQAYLSEDRMVLRFVDFEPLSVSDGSPLFLGFTVSSSDVGRGSLSIKMMLYRSVCTNGLLISSMGGTLYRKNHSGEGIGASKLQAFNHIFSGIDVTADEIVKNIEQCRGKMLKDYEMEMYMEKAKREIKLSEKSRKKLEELMASTYDRTKWGFINSMTELAQNFTLDTRLEMEQWAGKLFA